MRKTIELDVDVPDFLDDEFVTLLSMLTEEELSNLKLFIKGILFACGRYTLEQINFISHKESR